jgi:Na+-transporting NADH:ubiquinone oxidoreductase subunit B
MILQKQKIMRKVLIALLPIYIFAAYLYGIRLLILTPVIFGIGFLIEYAFEKHKNKKVSEAVFVTCSLYLLCLPPDIPIWIACIGIIVAVFLGKEVFGGFGRNPFNPAIAGRLFIYITFPNQMLTSWITPGNFGLDAVSSATPLSLMQSGNTPDLFNLFFGFHAGSFGETSVILILAGASFLIITKTANWKIILSTVLTGALFLTLFYLLKAGRYTEPHLGLMSGSFLFVTVFMATDPVSAPKKTGAQIIYGIIIGAAAVIIRTFSLFTEGTSFAVLIANTFSPLLDEVFTVTKKAVK